MYQSSRWWEKLLKSLIRLCNFSQKHNVRKPLNQGWVFSPGRPEYGDARLLGSRTRLDVTATVEIGLRVIWLGFSDQPDFSWFFFQNYFRRFISNHECRFKLLFNQAKIICLSRFGLKNVLRFTESLDFWFLDVGESVYRLEQAQEPGRLIRFRF